MGEAKEGKACCSFMEHGCHKYLIGGLAGLLLAGAGMGMYHMGKCAGKRGCPVKASQTVETTTQK